MFATLVRTPSDPHDEVGLRLQLTSANTEHQVSHLIDVLGAVVERFRLGGQDPAAARVAVDRALDQLVAR